MLTYGNSVGRVRYSAMVRGGGGPEGRSFRSCSDPLATILPPYTRAADQCLDRPERVSRASWTRAAGETAFVHPTCRRESASRQPTITADPPPALSRRGGLGIDGYKLGKAPPRKLRPAGGGITCDEPTPG